MGIPASPSGEDSLNIRTTMGNSEVRFSVSGRRFFRYSPGLSTQREKGRKEWASSLCGLSTHEVYVGEKLTCPGVVLHSSPKAVPPGKPVTHLPSQITPQAHGQSQQGQGPG